MLEFRWPSHLCEGVRPTHSMPQLVLFASPMSALRLSCSQDVMLNVVAQYFAVSPSGGGLDYTHLSPNVGLGLDFENYYAMCAPSTCTYSRTGPPSFFGAITAALGVIGGLQTALTLLIDRGVDTACKRRMQAQAAKDASARGAQGGDDSGAEALAGTGGDEVAAAPLAPDGSAATAVKNPLRQRPTAVT